MTCGRLFGQLGSKSRSSSCEGQQVWRSQRCVGEPRKSLEYARERTIKGSNRIIRQVSLTGMSSWMLRGEVLGECGEEVGDELKSE